MSLNAQFWFYFEPRWFHVSKRLGNRRVFPPFFFGTKAKTNNTKKKNKTEETDKTNNKLNINGRKTPKVMICCVTSRSVFWLIYYITFRFSTQKLSKHFVTTRTIQPRKRALTYIGQHVFLFEISPH